MNHWAFVIAAYAVTLLRDRRRCSLWAFAVDAPRRGARPTS